MSGKRVCQGHFRDKGKCNGFIEEERAVYKQTRYCAWCARIRKGENSLDPRTPEQRRDYLRRYMSEYRRSHPGLSSPYVRRYRAKKKRKRAADA